MTLIEVGGRIVIYSPVALTPSHTAQIRELGNVSTIIAPNLFHHFYLRACMTEFPNARVLVPQGLAEKIGAIPGAEVMHDELDLGAGEALDYAIFSGHKLLETVLFHRATGTLITADLLYNYQPEHFPVEKLFFRMVGCYGKPSVAFYHRFALQDKASTRTFIDAVRRWPIRRIVMSHGRIVDSHDAAQIFTDAWARFK